MNIPIKALDDVCKNIFAGGDVDKDCFSPTYTVNYTVPIYANGVENEGLYGYTKNARVTEPAITISARGTIGYTFIRNTPFYPIVRLIVCVPDSKIIHLKYLKYGLDNIEIIPTGTVQKQLPVPTVKNIKIPVPPLDEQRRIVRVLDGALQQVEGAIAYTHDALVKVQHLWHSALQHKLHPPSHTTWNMKALGDVANVIGGGTPSTKIPKYWNGDIAWLSPKDLTDYTDMYISRGAKNISELGLQKSSARLMPKGTVLISSRAPIGYVAIAENEICTNQGFKSVVIKKDIIPEYLYYWVKGHTEYLNSLGTGATFKEISGKTVKNIKIPIPPLNAQKRIVAELQNIEQHTQHLEHLYRQKLQKLHDVKQSFLQSAFRGEV